ncbi:hypothetical protein M0R45_025730 [Rubus argutus]|uniref:Uncharacterized protein n=1 Tax=Rubus argutus TaxID=59490 RepID=A0AAW1WXS8_RUBAR
MGRSRARLRRRRRNKERSALARWLQLGAPVVGEWAAAGHGGSLIEMELVVVMKVVRAVGRYCRFVDDGGFGYFD